MPSYNFDCETCKREWDDFIPSWDSPNPKCPKCGVRARRLPTAAQIGRLDSRDPRKVAEKQRYSNEGGRFMLEGMHEPVILPREPSRRRKTVASLFKKFRPEMVPEYNRTVAKVEAGK